MRLRTLSLALAALAAPAAIHLEPRHRVLQAGQTQAFAARNADGSPAACRFTVQGEGGRMDADGVFSGPPGLYRVRATRVDDPHDLDETGVLVLPDHGGLRSAAEAAPGIFEPGWSEALPFQDLVTGGRFGGPGQPVTGLPGPGIPERQILGYGLPATLRWDLPGLVPDAQLLSWLEGDEPVRLDPGLADGARVTLRGRVSQAQVERLNRMGPSTWTSRVQPLSIAVRGLLPLAGNAVAGPGDADGRGIAARFREPWGLAFLAGGDLVGADPEARALRRIAPDGTVTTLPAGPLLAPAFVAALPPGSPRGILVFSDAGDHTIRCMDEAFRVTVLAGGPGAPGCADAPDPRNARFNAPQGLAVDGEGTVYVADRGNHLLRRIAPSGAVTTMAGLPGAPGHQDGAGPVARFSALRGLALAPHGVLYAVDGHSVRRIGPEGWVTTLLGDPHRPGPPLQSSPGTPLDARVPCLDAPHGIAALGPELLVTDRGNRTLLAVAPASGGRVHLKILAGGALPGGTRFGLLRLGLARLPEAGAAYGALADPRGVAADARGDVFVADGTCVVQASLPRHAGLRPPVILPLPGVAVPRSAPFQVDFLGPSPLGAGPGLHLDGPVHLFWTLEALDPVTGKPVADAVRGEARGANRGRAELTWRGAGEVDLWLTCVTAEGIPSQRRLGIRVE